jgi:hypothetical protein
MKLIRAAHIEKETAGTGREIGRSLAQLVSPGDSIDFAEFQTIDNSFADEFVWNFLENHSPKDIESIRFQNETPLMQILLQRAINRRAFDVRIAAPTNPKIQRRGIDFLSELAD